MLRWHPDGGAGTPPEGGSGEPVAPEAPEPIFQQDPAEPPTDPKQPAPSLEELQGVNERLEKRRRDQDQHIGRMGTALQSRDTEIGRLRQQLEAMGRPPVTPAAAADGGGNGTGGRPDPVFQGVKRSLDDLEPTGLVEAIQQVVRREMHGVVRTGDLPDVMASERRASRIVDGFDELQQGGVMETPQELRLGDAVANAGPVEGYVAKLMQSGNDAGALEFLQGRVDARNKTAAGRKILDTISSGRGLSPEQRASLLGDRGGTSGPRPGEMGYHEGEGASLMYELGMASHARQVDDDQWVDDERRNVG